MEMIWANDGKAWMKILVICLNRVWLPLDPKFVVECICFIRRKHVLLSVQTYDDDDDDDDDRPIHSSINNEATD